VMLPVQLLDCPRVEILYRVKGRMIHSRRYTITGRGLTGKVYRATELR
jgi:hypothetical protein